MFAFPEARSEWIGKLRTGRKGVGMRVELPAFLSRVPEDGYQEE